jgi:RNA polymerase sigma factor (sigma-70 family)
MTPPCCLTRKEQAAEFTRLLSPLLRTAQDYASYICRSPDDGQDLAQEAIIVAWTRFDELRRHLAFHKWLFRIIESLNTAAWRSRRRSGRTSIEFEEDDPTIVDISTSSGGTTERIDVELMLALLDAHDRDAILLHILGGFALTEIGHAHGISADCMRKRLERARRRFARVAAGKARRSNWSTGIDATSETIRLVARQLAAEAARSGDECDIVTSERTPHCT